MLLSFGELVDIIIMTVFIGFIFSGFFKHPDKYAHGIPSYSFFDWKDFKFAALVTAPAIILHEFGHKFVAIAFGLTATFKAAYMWLGLGLILRLANFGFIFFVPAYVSIIGRATPLTYSITAFAGPAVNFALWGLSKLSLKHNWLPKKYDYALILTGRINLFLGIFNMIPIPPFDGYKVFSGLLETIL